MTTGSSLVREALAARNVTQVALAEMLGMSCQNIRNKMYRDSWSVKDVMEILTLLDFDLRMLDKQTNSVRL